MLQLRSIRHDFGGKILFHDLNLSFGRQRYGLVGPNGVGKTTLARILSGDLSPEGGDVLREGAVRYFAQRATAGDELLSSFLAEIWEAPTTHTEALRRLVEPLALERRLCELSGGEWVRARLAKLLGQDTGFLILDEPTNDLDRDGREVVLEFVRSYTGGLLVISHDRELLSAMDVILELSSQGLSTYGGDFEFYWDERTRERERQRHNLEEAKRFVEKKRLEGLAAIATQEKRMREGKKKGAKQGLPKILLGARKRKAEASMGKITKLREETNQRNQQEVHAAWEALKEDPFLKLDFSGWPAPAGKVLVHLQDFNWTHPGADQPMWTKPVTFRLRGTERWHLQGPNGAGKSTLLKFIAKTRGAALGYLDQAYGQLDPTLSVLENIQAVAEKPVEDLRNELAQYGFTGDKVFQPAGTLSGGELLKASLAAVFLRPQPPELLLLDEPTNNLDLNSLALLETALKRFQGAILVVSHDRRFLEGLGDLLVLELSRRENS